MVMDESTVGTLLDEVDLVLTSGIRQRVCAAHDAEVGWGVRFRQHQNAVAGRRRL